jgi:hypothetical protein
MFNKLIFLFFIFIASGLSASYADDSGKLIIPKTTSCAKQDLQLNGFGTRKKLFIKLYVSSLYVQEKTSEAKKLLDMGQAMCMRLHITSSKITSEKMVNATREGFDQSTNGNTDPIKNEIEKFLAWLKQPIKKGDVFEFTFIPHNQTHVSKNDKTLGMIENKEFSAALFGIWLGDKPVQQDLKDKLLGL